MSNSSLCRLCSNNKCTLHHILSNCPVALHTKRYTWRHDSVLLHIQLALQSHVNSWNTTKIINAPQISFVKAGDKSYKFKKFTSPPAKSELQGASDWKLLVDIEHDQIVFPPEILSTNQRPDIIIWSMQIKKVILIELTCPAEEGMVNAQLYKETWSIKIRNSRAELGSHFDDNWSWCPRFCWALTPKMLVFAWFFSFQLNQTLQNGHSCFCQMLIRYLPSFKFSKLG